MSQSDADWPVTCARCGITLPVTQMVIEEGDEWECPPCWLRCEHQERVMTLHPD